MIRPVSPVPPGTVLLHIGPQKTGTTAIQGAFHRSRPALREQGVRYAGPNRQSKQAARALRSAATEWQLTRHARRLIGDVRRGAEERVVVSAEAFADTEDAAIPHIVEALGGERVHVVVTLRPIARILPSQWQQFVQGGHAEPFEDFLRRALEAAPRGDAEPAGGWLIRRFWRRHRHDHLIARWARVVGRERVTAITMDERDRDASIGAFEDLLGLRPGTLAAPDQDNRSFTLAEAELVRELNAAFELAGMGSPVRLGLLPSGIAEHLKARPVEDGEPRIELPAWATDRVAEIAGQIVNGIRATKVDAIGSLESLRSPAAPKSVRRPAARSGWSNVAAAAAVGVLVAAGFARSRVPIYGRNDSYLWPDESAVGALVHEPELAGFSTPRISSVIGGRVQSIGVRAGSSLRAALVPPAAAEPSPQSAPVHSAAVEEQ